MLESVDTSVLVAQIAFAEGIGAAIISGVVALILKHFEKKAEENRLEAEKKAEEMREEDLKYRKEREERERLREERDALNYDLLFASANACDVVLEVIHDGKANGNVDKARESLGTAKSECNHFYNKQAARL